MIIAHYKHDHVILNTGNLLQATLNIAKVTIGHQALETAVQFTAHNIHHF
jgi:hypothetical protein